MAIAYFGSATGVRETSTNTIVISTPPSIPANALILLTVGGFCTSTTPTPSGGGWTNIDSGTSSSGAFWTWYKIASGGEGEITVTTDGSSIFGAGNSTVFTGVDTTTPIIAHSSAVWGGVTHTSLTSPSVNNTGTSTACAVFTGAFYNGSSVSGQTTPTNMTEAVDYGDGINVSTFSYYRLNAPTGSQSYSTTSSGQLDWYGGDSLLFLKEAGAAATNALPGCAATTVASNSPTLTLTGGAAPGCATVTGVALAGTVNVGKGATAGKAEVAVAGVSPTTNTVDNTSAPAGVANVAVVANTTRMEYAPAGVVGVSIIAIGSTVADGVPSGVAGAIAAARDPSLSFGVSVGTAGATVAGQLAGPGLGSQVGTAVAVIGVGSVSLYFGSSRMIDVGEEIRTNDVAAENRTLMAEES